MSYLHYFDFAIKQNNFAINSPCPICGERTNPSLGMEIFYQDAVICEECLVQHEQARKLATLLARAGNEKMMILLNYDKANKK